MVFKDYQIEVSIYIEIKLNEGFLASAQEVKR